MHAFVEVVIPVFSIILVGYALGRIKRFDMQTVVDLIVYLAAPCLIFSSVARSEINLTDFTTIAGAALAIILIMTLFVFFVLKLTHSDKRGLYLPLVFGNTSYLGYPVALLAFGMEGLSRAVVYDMFNSLLIFSLGISIVHQEHEFKEAFRLPLLYAVVIGLGVNLFNIPVPQVLFEPIEMIGMITIPAALLVLGYQLRDVPIRATTIALLASAYRILGGLMVAFVIITLFSIDGLGRDIILLQAAMPSAVMSMILAAKYNRDATLVASVVLMTTLLSTISIPLILALL
ncbi:MAG: AEC family transporter [Methanophagales archaeon ANME-1-THS]|nr:MAG: AEC family transporter [Methanophagales archaeon ANME-1-THS]